MDDDKKKTIIHEINLRIGGDIFDLSDANELEKELSLKKKQLQSSLNVATNEVPTKLPSVIQKAKINSEQVNELKLKSERLSDKIGEFLKRTEPLREELTKRIIAINKLEGVLAYIQSYENIENISNQIKQSSDDEQSVLLYCELKEMCGRYKNGHRANYIKDYTHYWHNVLKDKFAKQYEDVLNQLKWPFAKGVEHSPPPKEIFVKFNNLTKFLFLIEEPELDTIVKSENTMFNEDLYPCLPIKILLKPLKKRFTFHFTGTRQTARIDRPEWFLTQTLTWIKDHQSFVGKHVQPVADKLQLKNVKAGDEFNAGLIALAAERLHTVLGLYQVQGAKGALVDVDAAFAHAVDEALGFHKELTVVTGNDVNGVLSVLTKAEIFVRWLAVEKKYALAKMDEVVDSTQWGEAVGEGVGVAVGAAQWVPRAADWFVALLRTLHQRYAVLPQPGHRLQFLELQLELVEEWRVRLTQLSSAALDEMAEEKRPHGQYSHPNASRAFVTLAAVINAAHHTRSVLLQWAHSLHYLQLHYYRLQFQHFTQQQHRDNDSHRSSTSSEELEDTDEDPGKSSKSGRETDEALSLEEVEKRAKKLALTEVSRQNSVIEVGQFETIANLTFDGDTGDEESGVFGEAPALLARLRDAGLTALTHHIFMEFKAHMPNYINQKWQAMLVVEEQALCVSRALCPALGSVCAAMAAAEHRLAPPLSARLRALLATQIDNYILQEVCLENWFNTGGTVQFTHDVKRNLIPAFAPANKQASKVNQMPKLLDACKLLNMDYDDARHLVSALTNHPKSARDELINLDLVNVMPEEAMLLLARRTDLCEQPKSPSVLEIF